MVVTTLETHYPDNLLNLVDLQSRETERAAWKGNFAYNLKIAMCCVAYYILIYY